MNFLILKTFGLCTQCPCRRCRLDVQVRLAADGVSTQPCLTNANLMKDQFKKSFCVRLCEGCAWMRHVNS